MPAAVLASLVVLVAGGCRSEHHDDAGQLQSWQKEKMPAHVTAELPKANYTAVEVRDGGSITGSVRLAGPAPVLPDFQIDGAANACASAAHNNRLTVGTNRGIAGAVVYLVNVAQGKPMPAFAHGELVLDQNGCQYRPHVLAAPVGAEVDFLNSDDMPHNVRVQSVGHDSVLLNVTQGARGKNDPWLIDRAGPLEVSCDYHPWMNAYLFGVANPYYAVTATDGKFTIRDIPPGTYTLKIWLNGFETTPKRDNRGQLVGYAFGHPYMQEQKVEVKPGKPASAVFEVRPR
ncbi:MAG: hypothetical protein JST22_15860 [Bacteroidetes bacterium]|nr:hypothetical protein [Bacteroidota bacterium]